MAPFTMPILTILILIAYCFYSYYEEIVEGGNPASLENEDWFANQENAEQHRETIGG